MCLPHITKYADFHYSPLDILDLVVLINICLLGVAANRPTATCNSLSTAPSHALYLIIVEHEIEIF
jgi:hypothetical protein